MIEENEGADHLPLAVRQRAAHLESIAEVAGARYDDKFKRIAGTGIAEHGIVGGLPAHEVSKQVSAIILRHRCSDKPRDAGDPWQASRDGNGNCLLSSL